MKSLLCCCGVLAAIACVGEPFGLVPAPQKMVVTGGELHVRTLEPVLERDASLPSEGYRLIVASNGVRIASSTATGAFWARQTLKQLATVAADGTRIPCVTIEDAPAYPWRGLHLDESRHFFGKDIVKRFLDRMAEHKLNVFHWHLTDSAGWRLQIDAFPKLVEVGAVHTVWKDYRSFREYPGHPSGTKLGPLYYTKDDVREILAYARARHIRVVPEIEIPGHSAEVAKAYPELRCERGADPSYKMFEHDLCVGTDATYRFFEKVLDEVCDLFDDEFIHIGGDECNMGNWKQCPRCQALMKREGFTDVSQLQARITRHFADYLAKKRRRIVGWSEIASGGQLPSDAAVMSWMGAAAGAWTICCNAGNFYFDYEQGIVDDPVPNYFWGWPTSLEKVYAFDGMNTMKGRERVLGGQANNWTEMTINERELQWKVWPRACAVAELFWRNPQPKDFSEFAARVAIDRRRMIADGVNVAPITRMDPVWEALNRHASRIGGGTTVTGIACAISRRGEREPRLTFNGWERKKDLVSMSRVTRIPVGPQIAALLKAVGREDCDLTLAQLVALGRTLADNPVHAAAIAANPPSADLSVARLEINPKTGEVRAWYAIPVATNGTKGLAAAKADFDACR